MVYPDGYSLSVHSMNRRVLVDRLLGGEQRASCTKMPVSLVFWASDPTGPPTYISRKPKALERIKCRTLN